MLDIYQYETASKEECELDLAQILDYLDKYLQDLVNYGLDDDELVGLEKKGERIVEIAKRLQVLGEENDN